MSTLAPTLERFRAADRQTRLDLLLDYAKKLPPLPQHLEVMRNEGMHMVPECMSPVFLWLTKEPAGLRLYADAPREAPTVRGFVALLERAVRDAEPTEVTQLPNDLLERLGLVDILGMSRIHGLTAILQRVKKMAEATAKRSAQPPTSAP
jgi:cysteine desulfuration protein SufE